MSQYDAAGLIASILDNPEDDAPRLIIDKCPRCNGIGYPIPNLWFGGYWQWIPPCQKCKGTGRANEQQERGAA